MKRTLIPVLLVVMATLAPAALADPPHGDGAGAHIHHIHLPTGCKQIDHNGQVTWFPEERGLHRGANSSGVETAVWHGPCH